MEVMGGHLKDRGHLEDPGIDGVAILKCNWIKMEAVCSSETSANFCRTAPCECTLHSNEPLCYI
jgi:hypothetical protein